MFGDKFKLGNLAGLMKNAGKIQEMMKQAEQELSRIIVTGEAGAGLVKVTVTAKHVVQKIEINDELLSEDKTIMEELIAAAMNDANAKIETETKSRMADFSSMIPGGTDNNTG